MTALRAQIAGVGPSLLALLVAVLLGLSASAQTPRQWMKVGDQAIEAGDHYGAAFYYKRALDADSTELGVYYKYAEALRGYNDYSKAEGVYGWVYDHDEARAREFPEALFWQATMQKYNGRYEAAKSNFELYRQEVIDKTSYTAKKAKNEIGSCAFALVHANDSADVEVLNAGGSINTIGSEFSAMMVSDSVLYFSSLRNDSLNDENEVLSESYLVKISRANKVNGEWVSEGPLDTAINRAGLNQANGALSLDSNRLYFTRCKAQGECSLWVAKRGSSGWANPQPVRGTVNLEGFSSTQPCVARMDDKEVLIFASNREGGRGKYDLWYSILKKEGMEVGKPKNFGSEINTIDNEITPYYEPATGLLYFSSDWHYGLGGLDVFSVAGGLDPAEPKNVGPPINSSVNDLYFSIDTVGKYGFVTSNRSGSITVKGETCCNDLYTIEYPIEIPPDTLVEDTPIVLTAKRLPIPELENYLPVLYFHNDEPNPRNWDTTTTLTYPEAYASYKALQTDYLNLYARGSNKSKEECDAAMNGFYTSKVDYGLEVLEAFAQRLLQQLDSGQHIELTVKGYASPLAKSNYNVNLTMRRIASFTNYLRTYNEGVYVPYLENRAANGGALSIIKIPYGEYLASDDVNANVNDQRNSVYSVKAGLERRIEVLSATKPNPNAVYPAITFLEEIHNFGKVLPGQKLKHKFLLMNTGNEPLELKAVKPSCGCTVANYTQEAIAPGKTGFIELTFDTTDKLGNQIKTATVVTNGQPAEKVLTVTAEILTEEEMPW